MALTIQPIDLGDNFRTWRDRFNVLIGYMNHTLQDTNNLSDLLNKATARTNLDVWSKAEATTLFLDTASNLSEINANGESAREAARVNIDVWSRTQADARYYEESKFLSEIAGAPNAANRDTMHTNIDVYKRGVLYTRTEADERYFQANTDSVTPVPDTDILDYKRDGTYSAIVHPVAGGAANGTVISLSPIGSGRYQIYAPQKESVVDVLNGTVYGDKSAMYIRNGWGAALTGWERLLSTSMGDATYFRKNLLLSEVTGVARATDRRTLTDNIDVYQKADVYTKTESESNYHRKTVTWTRTESDARFNQVTNYLSEISSAGTAAQLTARNNLSVYSKAENDANYYVKSLLWTKTESDARFNKVANYLSEISAAGTAAQLTARTNLSVYSKAENDTNYYVKNLLWTKTESDARFLQVSNSLVELKNLGAGVLATTRSNLDVYSKSEMDTRYVNDNRDDMFSEVAGSINMSDIQRDKMHENLGVYSRAAIDASYQTGASTYLAKNMNLADVADKAAGRTNLGLGNTATNNFITAGVNDLNGYSGNSIYIARSNHNHANISFYDSRGSSPLPNALPMYKGKEFEFKTNLDVLGGTVGSYVGLETSAIWTAYNDAHRPYQMAYDAGSANGRIYHRIAASATTWGAWKTLAYVTDTVADATQLDGQSASYYLDWNNVTNKPSIAPLVHNHDTAYLGITANAVSATKLVTARTIAITGAVTGTATSFDGTANISIATTALNASNLSAGTVPDARLSGSYTGFANLTGTGTLDFSRFLGNAADTVTAPSFSWTGDLDTGIYSPAADQMAITTGGVQRALFNASGVTATTFIGALSGNATTATNAVGILSSGGTVILQTSAVGGYFNFTSSGSSVAAGVRVGSLIATNSYTNVPPPIGQISATQFNGELNGNATSATTAGNATTATTLQTARTINGVSFNGSANITVVDTTKLPITGGSLSGNLTMTSGAGIAPYADNAGFVGTPSLRFNNINAVSFVGALTGNATTATTLQTARTINGVSFNGSANITVADATKLPLTGGTLTGAIAGTVASFPQVNATKINMDRAGTVGSGISYYNSVYNAWQSYMAQAGVTGQGIRANITPSAGSLVTAWSLRSVVENTAGYGWVWESMTNNGTTPTIMMELSAVSGALRTIGAIYAPTFVGSLAGNANTAGYAGSSDRVNRQDTRDSNSAPSAYGDGIEYHFKANATDGFSAGGGTYHRILNLDAWGGTSGGLSGQMAFGDNGTVGWRGSASDTAWEAWKTFVFTGENIGTSASNYAAGNHGHTPAQVGLSNVPNMVHTSDGNASTVVLRDSAADINVRLVRSTFPNEASISGGIVYRVNNTTDNYNRVCSDPTAVRTWIGAAAASHTHAYLPLTGGTLTGALAGTTATFTTVTGTSDRTLKTNIETIKNPLETVKQLRGVSYDWIDSGKSDVGVIAQEVQEVIPEVVHEDDKGMLSVDYSHLVGHLIEAIKALEARVAELEAK